MKTLRATGSHLSLFVGARNLATVWHDAAHWLRKPAPNRDVSRAGGTGTAPFVP